MIFKAWLFLSYFSKVDARILFLLISIPKITPLDGGVGSCRHGQYIWFLHQLCKVDGLGIPRRTVEEGEDSPAVGLLRPVHHVPEKVLVAVPTEAGGHCALDLAIELSAAAAPSLHLTQPWSYDQIQPTVLAAHHVIFFSSMCTHFNVFRKVSLFQNVIT